MIPHHQGAIEMAEVALTNAGHKEIKQLSRNIVSTQQAEIEELAGSIMSAQKHEIEQMRRWREQWYPEG